MRGLLRRLRGMIKTGLTWAVGWGGAFMAFAAVRSVMTGFGTGIFEALMAGGAIGFISGGVFAGVLSLTEGKKTLAELSLMRVALWGAVGGMAIFAVAIPRLIAAGLPLELILEGFLGPVLFTGLLGAGSAAGTVALAKKAEDHVLGGSGANEPFLLDDG